MCVPPPRQYIGCSSSIDRPGTTSGDHRSRGGALAQFGLALARLAAYRRSSLSRGGWVMANDDVGTDAQAIFHGPWPDVDIPDVPLAPFVLRRAHELADKAAIVDGVTGRTLTYGQLADGIRRTAVGLSRRGLGKGDVLAIYSPNLPEYALAFHGTALL